MVKVGGSLSLRFCLHLCSGCLVVCRVWLRKAVVILRHGLCFITGKECEISGS